MCAQGDPYDEPNPDPHESDPGESYSGFSSPDEDLVRSPPPSEDEQHEHQEDAGQKEPQEDAGQNEPQEDAGQGQQQEGEEGDDQADAAETSDAAEAPDEFAAAEEDAYDMVNTRIHYTFHY